MQTTPLMASTDENTELMAPPSRLAMCCVGEYFFTRSCQAISWIFILISVAVAAIIIIYGAVKSQTLYIVLGCALLPTIGVAIFKNSKVTKDMMKLNSQHKALNAQQASQIEELTEQVKEIDRVKRELVEVEEKYEDNLAELALSLGQAQTQAADLMQLNQEIKAERNALEIDVETLGGQIEEFQAARAQFNDTVRILRGQIAELGEEKDQLAAHISTLSDQNEKQRIVLESLQALYDQSQAFVQNVVAKTATLGVYQEELSETASNLATTQAEFSEGVGTFTSLLSRMNQTISEDEWKAMDINGDGVVDRDEYLRSRGLTE